jgi:hypothetical protein
MLVSCKKNDNIDFFSTKFKIEGNFKSTTNYKKIYLNYIFGNEFVLMDSADIIKGNFIFKGYVNSPKKALLQFYPNGDFFTFILYGENIKITIDENNLTKSMIFDSEINKEWASLSAKSKEIYGAIDYMYPMIQKSRVQNDLAQLKIISNKIDSIETLNRKFLLDYIKQNPNSKLNGLILNDLYAQTKNDSLEILQTIEKLPIEIQKTLIIKTTQN